MLKKTIAILLTCMLVLSTTAYAADNAAIASLDAAHSPDGYVTTSYNQPTEKRLKTRITGPDGSIKIYDMQPNTETVIPLAAGDGPYTLTIFLQTQGITYSPKLTQVVTAKIENPASPYLCSTQHVNYKNATETTAKAKQICQSLKTDTAKALAIYNFIAKFPYDIAKAETIESGYLSSPDKTLTDQAGVCLDFAVLAAAMLRSQGIPCKLVYGYAGPAYHAWISAYIDKTWTPIDPTARPGVIITEFPELQDYIPTSAY